MLSHVYYTNARSLINKIDELRVVCSIERPLFVAVSETWFFESILDSEISINNYNLIRGDRKFRKGGGVALYVRQGIEYSEAELPNKYVESLWVNIKLSRKEKILVGVVYRPPNCSDDENLKLLETLQLLDTSQNVLILGDFNYSDINWNSHSCKTRASDQFINKIHDKYLHQVTEEATRNKAILDLVLTSDVDLIEDLVVGEPLGNSDHNSIRLHLSINSKGFEVVRRKLAFENADYMEMNKFFKRVDWDLILSNSLNIEDQWLRFKSVIMDCCNKFVPTRKIKNGNRRAPWMNRELLRLVKRKRCEYNKAKLSGLVNDWKKYKEILNKCTHEIRVSKSQYEEKLAKNVKQNPKAFYSYVNRTKSKKDTIGPLNVNGKVIDSAKDMAKELNLYFSSVFSKIDSNRDLVSTEIQCEHCVTDIIITEDIVLDKLRTLKPINRQGLMVFIPESLRSYLQVLAIH